MKMNAAGWVTGTTESMLGLFSNTVLDSSSSGTTHSIPYSIRTSHFRNARKCPYHKPGGLKEKWDGILKEGNSGTERLRQERYRQCREGRLAEELNKNRATAEK